jgi:hypothetical protein
MRHIIALLIVLLVLPTTMGILVDRRGSIDTDPLTADYNLTTTPSVGYFLNDSWVPPVAEIIVQAPMYRQHQPSWNVTGSVAAFDDPMAIYKSRIVSWNPAMSAVEPVKT